MTLSSALGKIITAIKNPFTGRDRGEKRMADLVGPWSQWRGVTNRQWDQATQVLHYKSWVQRCVEFIAEGVRLPPEIVTVKPQGMREDFGVATKGLQSRRKMLAKYRQKAAVGPIKSHEEYEFLPDDHPAVRLVNDPNEFQTGVKFWQLLTTYEELTGNSFIWIVNDAMGMPVELWVLPSQWVRPVNTGLTGKMVDYYEVRAVSGPVQVFSADEIIWSRNENPWHPLMVTSRVQSASTTIDAYEMTDAARYVGLENSAMIGGVFSYPADVNVTQVMIDRLNDRLSARQVGVQNAFRPFIADGGLEWTPPSGELELAFMQSQDQLRKHIMAQFGLDESMMGFANHSTYAAAVITKKGLFERVFAPRMENRAATLTELLLPRFGPDLRAIYLPDSTTDDPDARRADWQVAVSMNAVTINEVRTELLGLEPSEDPTADELPQDPLTSMSGWDQEPGQEKPPGEGVPKPSIPAFGDKPDEGKGLVNRITELNGKSH